MASGRRATTNRNSKDGFEQFKITWNKDLTNFQFTTDDGLHFYGWWRYTKILKTNTLVHAVDIFVKRDTEEKPMDVCVESIIYYVDPRDSLRSLNADICGAANKWFYQNFNGKLDSIDSLIKQAKYPTIHVNRINTIDNIILRLREFRHVAITSGGTRTCELRGDKDQPPLLISINVTEQAIALKGHAPSMAMANMVDRAINKEEIRTDQPANHGASPENVRAIVEQLRTTVDKSQARKLRAILRSMGHRGGAR